MKNQSKNDDKKPAKEQKQLAPGTGAPSQKPQIVQPEKKHAKN